MRKICLGYKAYDLHELTCHFVAKHAGLYTSNGLDVTLEDTRLVADDGFAKTEFSVACGSALIRWLNGEQLKVVVAAAERPMFWLHARKDFTILDDLFARTITSYPEAAPPARFLRVILAEAGLEPDKDVRLVPVRDDAARIEMLRSGDADAALISSAILPYQMAELGFRELLCLGDRIQIPTTGLAITLKVIREDRATVDALKSAFRGALRLINDDKKVLVAALRESELVTGSVELAGEVVRRFFSVDGQVERSNITDGVRRFTGWSSLPLPADPATFYEEIYRH